GRGAEPIGLVRAVHHSRFRAGDASARSVTLLSRSAGWGRRGRPGEEAAREMLGRAWLTAQHPRHLLTRGTPLVDRRLNGGGERMGPEAVDDDAIESGDAEIVRHTQAQLLGGADDSGCEQVTLGDDRRGAV